MLLLTNILLSLAAVALMALGAFSGLGAHGMRFFTTPLVSGWEAVPMGAAIAGGALVVWLVRRIGKWTVKTPAGGTQVFAYVYDTDLGGDDFFGAMCGGMFENGTPPLAPLAVGMVTLENRDRNIADITTALSGTGPFNASLNNSITGLVSDRDGNVFELDARFKGKLRATGAVSCTGDCSVTLTPHAG